MKKIYKLLKKIVLSGFTIFAFNIMAKPLNFVIPIIERISNKVTLKEQVRDFAPQPVFTFFCDYHIILFIGGVNVRRI